VITKKISKTIKTHGSLIVHVQVHRYEKTKKIRGISMLCYAVHQCLMHIPTVRRKGGGNLSFFSSEYFCMSWNYIGTPYKMSIKIKTESKHLILSNRIIWKETLHNNINFAISFIVMVVKHKGYTQVGVIMWNEKSIICKDDERSSRMSRRFIEIQNPTVSHCPLLGGRGEWCEEHHIGNGKRLSKTFISVEVFFFFFANVS